MMMQAQYRTSAAPSRCGSTTRPDGRERASTGIQWAQINVTGGTIVATPVQQQIYGNVGGDGLHRWMGSLAVDKDGNMALGYSVASASATPTSVTPAGWRATP